MGTDSVVFSKIVKTSNSNISRRLLMNLLKAEQLLKPTLAAPCRAVSMPIRHKEGRCERVSGHLLHRTDVTQEDAPARVVSFDSASSSTPSSEVMTPGEKAFSLGHGQISHRCKPRNGHYCWEWQHVSWEFHDTNAIQDERCFPVKELCRCLPH